MRKHILVATAIAVITGCAKPASQQTRSAPPAKAAVVPDSREAQLLQRLREDPLNSHAEASWFSKLSTDKERAFAAHLGQILLDSDSPGNFVVGFGADKSPYPWTFVVSEDSVDLNAENTFAYVLRNDQYVKSEWGVHWIMEQVYDTKETDGKISFQRPTSRKGDGDGIWVPAAGWRYVGPALPRTEGGLNAVNE